MLSSCYLVRKTSSTAWREKCLEKEEIRVILLKPLGRHRELAKQDSR